MRSECLYIEIQRQVNGLCRYMNKSTDLIKLKLYAVLLYKLKSIVTPATSTEIIYKVEERVSSELWAKHTRLNVKNRVIYEVRN